MKYQSLALLFFLVASQTLADSISPLNNVVEKEKLFSPNFSYFAYNDYEDNAIVSPLSAYLLLAQTAYGAGGNTAEQLNKALFQSGNASLYSNDFKDLLKELKEAKNVTLNLANRIVAANGLELNKNFVDYANDVFDSQVSSFTGSPKELADDINNWVDKKTNHKIRNLFDGDDLDDSTSLVLLNALYFNGEWEIPFDARGNRIFDFTDLNKKKHKVMTMIHAGKIFNHGKLRKFEADFIELPYKNSDFKMLLVVPTEEEIDAREFNRLGEELKKLNYSDLKKLSSESEVTLVLPKFKFESQFDLRPVLEKMGMTDMFTNKAQFRNFVKDYKNEKLVVSKVIQKAVIDVNEIGSEASASTGSSVIKKSGNTLIRAMKPFYFSILSDKYGVLFSGKVLLPKY